jgi:acyl dehydratase
VTEIGPREVEFSREQITAYAEASGDRNPIHLDDGFARSVGLPGVIAHGMLQMGILASVLAEPVGDPRRLRRLGCRFAAMVRPGDRVSFGGRAAAGGEVELWARNQAGEDVLTRARAELFPE